MEILVDKRTELMSIILALSQGNEYVEEHFSLGVKDQYRDQVLEHFSKYQNHKCIEIAKSIAKKQVGFSFDNPIRLAFSLSENLSFDDHIDNYLLSEIGDEGLLKEFMAQVVEFAKESQFVDFFDAHKDYYLSKIQDVENLFNGKIFEKELKKFLKRNIEEDFQINIIPMLVNANHGFKVENTNIANIGLPTYDYKKIEKFNNGYRHIIIHEFCHNYVNNHTNKSKLDLPTAFEYILGQEGYKNPISYLNDTIVRALTIRLRERIENTDLKYFFSKEYDMGFVYVKDVYAELLNYEKQDLIWEEFFSKLLSNIVDRVEAQKTKSKTI